LLDIKDGIYSLFDRGAVDALGMLAESEAMAPAEIEANLQRYPYHKVVFLFPPWQEIYRTDDERDQTFAESIRVFEAPPSEHKTDGLSRWIQSLLSRRPRAKVIVAVANKIALMAWAVLSKNAPYRAPGHAT